MIASLSGKMLQKKHYSILLDVHGVGYEIYLSEEDQKNLPLSGHDLFLWTHLHIKETQWTLFGFLKMQKRDFFKHLLSVNGLGPKLALSCVGALEPQDVVQIVLSQSPEKLQEIPGIGKKMAARLVLELGSILKKIGGLGASNAQDKRLEASLPTLPTIPWVEEAIQAMRQLGYKDETMLRKMTTEVMQKDQPESVNDLLKSLLRRFDVRTQ